MILRKSLPIPRHDSRARARARARARKRNWIFLIFCLLFSITFPNLHAQSPTSRSLWNSYQRVDFTVASRPCILVSPKFPASGKPWIWRTEFFGHEPQADIALLHEGFHVAYMNLKDMYGSPASMKLMDAFYENLTTSHGLSQRVVLEGFSRGGLFAFNWAARNPHRVASIYADAPVLDIKSWPGGKGSGPGSPKDWIKCQQAYGMTEAELMEFKGNPLDNLAPLAAAKIPILLIAGAKDKTVPFSENAEILIARYHALNAPIEPIIKPEGDHHPHSLKDPPLIVDFILRAVLR